MSILMLTRAERAALRVKCRTLPTVQEGIAAELHPWLHFRQRMTDSKIDHVLSPRAWYMYNKVSDVITILQEMSSILASLQKSLKQLLQIPHVIIPEADVFTYN